MSPALLWPTFLPVLVAFVVPDSAAGYELKSGTRSQLLRRKVELPKFPYDVSAVSSAQCQNDLTFWYESLQNFVGAMAIPCVANDTACAAQKAAAVASNLFAAQQIDSFGRIPSNLFNFNNLWEGSYEECMAVKAPARSDYRGQFCWASVVTPIVLMAAPQEAADPNICTTLGSESMLTSWSVCMPRSCSDSDITALLQTVNNYTRGNLIMCYAKCRPYKLPKKNGAFWVVTMYIAIAVFAMIVASVVDYYTIDCKKEAVRRFRSTTGMKCLLAFSMYTNASDILSVTKRPGQINCLHCIRVVSMTWVMAGHILLQFMQSDDLLKLLQLNSYFLNLAFTNAFFSVDSFLFLGGLLMTYLFIKEMDRSPGKLKSPVYWTLFYVHRIIRLGVPYYLFIGFSVVYTAYLTRGPAQVDTFLPAEACRKYWWRNVLYINNLWDLSNLCLGHTWYLSIDMQIHLFAPVLLVPLCLSPIAGAVSAFLLLGMSTALNYNAYFKYNSPASLMGEFRPNNPAVNLLASQNFQQYVYFATWIRYTPYVIGALTGYFLFKTKDKKWRLHPIISLVLWLCAAAIAVACVYGLYDYLTGTDLPIRTRASYYNWSRIGWSVALAWVVIACEHNWAGPIKNFMEMGMWMPFSRLTYCAYLCHFTFIFVVFAMTRQAIHFVSITEMYINWFLPSCIVSYAFAFLWSCAFEIPGGKLEKMGIDALFGRRPPPPPSVVEKSVKPIGVTFDPEQQKSSPPYSSPTWTVDSDPNGRSMPRAQLSGSLEESGLKRRPQNDKSYY